MKRITTLCVLLCLIVVLGACGLIVPRVATNVPSDRLSSETYTSPGGEFTVRIPRLGPGPGIEERQIDPLSHIVVFSDYFGRVYSIVIADNQETGSTLDAIAKNLQKNLQVGEFLREKEIIDTGRGPELRLVGIKRGGSPLVTRTKVSGGWETKKNDLVEARSIFLHGNYIYEIGAGVTPGCGWSPSPFVLPAETLPDTGGALCALESESALMARAVQHLDQFLRGLVTTKPAAASTTVEMKSIDSRTPESDQSVDVGIRALCEGEFARAIEILRPHAEQGNVNAQVILGMLFREDGDGQIRDEGLSWLRKAADQRDWGAQLALGAIYSQGKGVKVDFNEAVKWYSKTAEAGVSLGQYNLAYAHEVGKGAVQDHAKAMELYTMAANQGNVWAQSNLGHGYYYGGRGVKADNAQAYKWLLLASEEGDKPAKQLLDKIRPSMTGGEIKEAERLANSFVPKLSPAEKKMLAPRCPKR